MGEITQAFIASIAQFLRETYEHPCEFETLEAFEWWAECTATALFDELGLHGEVSWRGVGGDGHTWPVTPSYANAVQHYAFVTRWEPVR